MYSEQLVHDILETVELLPDNIRENFLKKLMPSLMEQDIHDEYADWVADDRFPTFSKLYQEEDG